ncbi:MAG TPA: hypothetical protein EYP98_07105, partial [Planctomycetes bacterium]|nr:hypothetical protein [Planctomycetota bacterium]
KTMADAGHEKGLKVHLDGARIFNAAVALDVPASDLVEHVDSATFCLSKGLSCPIGSVVVGSKDFIDEADRWRKMLGAGMRQVGIVAAAGLVALDTMIHRMQEDHDSARHMASRMAEMPGISVDPERIQTNIIRFDVPAHKGNEIAVRPVTAATNASAGMPVPLAMNAPPSCGASVTVRTLRPPDPAQPGPSEVMTGAHELWMRAMRLWALPPARVN